MTTIIFHLQYSYIIIHYYWLCCRLFSTSPPRPRSRSYSRRIRCGLATPVSIRPPHLARSTTSVSSSTVVLPSPRDLRVVGEEDVVALPSHAHALPAIVTVLLEAR